MRQPNISDWPTHPEHGGHPARKKMLQAARHGLDVPARTSQHKDNTSQHKQARAQIANTASSINHSITTK
jgi:hypothetical protein